MDPTWLAMRRVTPWAVMGGDVDDLLGDELGKTVGAPDGDNVGDAVVGALDGEGVGDAVVGVSDGDGVVGELDGEAVGEVVV